MLSVIDLMRSLDEPANSQDILSTAFASLKNLNWEVLYFATKTWKNMTVQLV